MKPEELVKRRKEEDRRQLLQQQADMLEAKASLERMRKAREEEMERLSRKPDYIISPTSLAIALVVFLIWVAVFFGLAFVLSMYLRGG